MAQKAMSSSEGRATKKRPRNEIAFIKVINAFYRFTLNTRLAGNIALVVLSFRVPEKLPLI